MSVLSKIIRHLAWRGRVKVAHAERDAARREAAEHSAVIRRILDQAVELGEIDTEERPR